MNKEDIVFAVTSKYPMNKKDATAVVDYILFCMQNALMHGEEVRIPNFITMSTKIKEERTCFSPATKERIFVPEKRVPVAKFSPKFIKQIDVSK